MYHGAFLSHGRKSWISGNFPGNLLFIAIKGIFKEQGCKLAIYGTNVIWEIRICIPIVIELDEIT